MLSKTANASRAGTALGTQRRAHRISREHAGATAAVWKAQRISCERGERWHPSQSRDCPARRCFQRPERARAFRLGRSMPDHADRSSGWSLKTVAAKGISMSPLRTHLTLPGVERQASDVSPPRPGGKLWAPVSPPILQGLSLLFIPSGLEIEGSCRSWVYACAWLASTDSGRESKDFCG